MCSIVIQGAFTQATPAGSPGTSPLKQTPPPPPHLTPHPHCSPLPYLLSDLTQQAKATKLSEAPFTRALRRISRESDQELQHICVFTHVHIQSQCCSSSPMPQKNGKTGITGKTGKTGITGSWSKHTIILRTCGPTLVSLYLHQKFSEMFFSHA